MAVRKFRFDSFASEFGDLNGSHDPDSKEKQSMTSNSRLCQVESGCENRPWSLTLCQNKSPIVRQHWKKSLKDQASDGQQSKKQRLFTGTPFQEEAENLCLQDLRRQSTESSAAQALLSLGRTDREMFIPYGQNNILREKPQEFFLSCNKLQHMPNGFPSIPILHTPLREIQSYLNSEADHRPKSVMTKPLSGLENQVPSNKKPSSKAYHCSECKKGFSTQSGFIKHDELHKSNQIQRDFSCRFCNKFYTTLSALKMHVRTHTLPCKCNICGKSFSRPWLLQGHVRTHTGEKPFSCNFCLRSFADKSNLRAHLQTHLQTKKYSCQKCQKTFSRMSLLNKHTESNCKSGQISVLLRS